MRRIIATVAIAATLAIPAAATSGNGKPVCHWTQFKRGNVSYHVQVCTVKRSRHHVDSRWTHAGPGNTTVKPRIG